MQQRIGHETKEEQKENVSSDKRYTYAHCGRYPRAEQRSAFIWHENASQPLQGGDAEGFEPDDKHQKEQRCAVASTP